MANNLRFLWGKLKGVKKSTKEIMDIIDEGKQADFEEKNI